MPQSRHFGADSNTMQQLHGAGVKSKELFRNYLRQERCINVQLQRRKSQA
jgi:hypothetical protein